MKAISTTTNSTSTRMLTCRGSFGVSAATGALRADVLRAAGPAGLPRGRDGTEGGVLRVPAEPEARLPPRRLLRPTGALRALPPRVDAPLPAARERLRGVGGRRVVTCACSRSTRRSAGHAWARAGGQPCP